MTKMTKLTKNDKFFWKKKKKEKKKKNSPKDLSINLKINKKAK